MDISPLFVLRQRLHAAALAGAASCPGDARLAQACEALAPLEAAAPVFRKLGDLVRRLRGPEGEGRAAVLLEALTLADALACTQAAVAVPGEAEPVVPAGQGGAMADVPYSVLASFRKDLLSSRKSSPERLWASPELRPEFFHEYRLYGFLRQGLAAQGGYAKDIVEWLAARGEDILPLLEDGFDPDGGKEMAWRVKVLERARSAAANDFYCAQLDRGGSAAVRRELIYALQHDKSNTARLLELCRTEKGKLAAMARWALARMDDPAAWAYFRALLPKQPRQVMTALEFACGGQEAGELVAGELERLLAPLVADDAYTPSEKEERAIQEAFYALPGKTGPAVCDAYRRMAALGATLDERLWLRHKFLMYGRDRRGHEFQVAVALTLREAILRQPDEGLLALAEELMRTASSLFVIPYLTGMLLLRPAVEAYEAAKRLLAPQGFARGSLTDTGCFFLQRIFDIADIDMSRTRHGLSCGWFNSWAARYDMSTVYDMYRYDPGWATGEIEKRGCRGYTAWWWSESLNRGLMVFRPFAEPLDVRWLEGMMSPDTDAGTCRLMFRLADLGDASCCARLGRFFHDWMLGKGVSRFTAVSNTPRVMRGNVNFGALSAPVWMYCCGWTDFRGLMESWFRRYGMNYITMGDFASMMEHIAPQTFIEEMEYCLELLRRGELQPEFDTSEELCRKAKQHIDSVRRHMAARSRKAASDRA